MKYTIEDIKNMNISDTLERLIEIYHTAPSFEIGTRLTHIYLNDEGFPMSAGLVVSKIFKNGKVNLKWQNGGNYGNFTQDDYHLFADIQENSDTLDVYKIILVIKNKYMNLVGENE